MMRHVTSSTSNAEFPFLIRVSKRVSSFPKSIHVISFFTLKKPKIPYSYSSEAEKRLYIHNAKSDFSPVLLLNDVLLVFDGMPSVVSAVSFAVMKKISNGDITGYVLDSGQRVVKI